MLLPMTAAFLLRRVESCGSVGSALRSRSAPRPCRWRARSRTWIRRLAGGQSAGATAAALARERGAARSPAAPPARVRRTPAGRPKALSLRDARVGEEHVRIARGRGPPPESAQAASAPATTSSPAGVRPGPAPIRSRHGSASPAANAAAARQACTTETPASSSSRFQSVSAASASAAGSGGRGRTGEDRTSASAARRAGRSEAPPSPTVIGLRRMPSAAAARWSPWPAEAAPRKPAEAR